mmetsp:Transcript_49/g.78  ORF Transcript_49/g.78 Transcript_49/m.78 type:complete len:370 (-) Transcript_49:213-1322(-)
MTNESIDMPNEIKAMGFTEAKGDVKLITYKTKPLSKTDADIRITYNGVCHSDLHMIDNDWGMSRYPLVPGHEIVGHVIGVGSDVTDLKVGDAVCLGCVCQSCLTCSYCTTGYDNLCASRQFTYFASTTDETGSHPHHGGFGAYMRTDARKLFKVPDGLEEKYVGPLMCAGITTFEPLFHYLNGVDGKGKTIGVMGIGGLGHMAVQFAAKMGATVVALSRGTSKEKFAKELGATSLIDTTSESAMAGAVGTLDQIILTVAGGFIDVDKLTPLMKPNGNIHFCGVPDEDVKFNVQPLLFGRLSLTANIVGGKKDTEAMLQFAAKHQCLPIIEVFPHSQAAEAIQKVRDGSIRFRAVLENDIADGKRKSPPS